MRLKSRLGHFLFVLGVCAQFVPSDANALSVGEQAPPLKVEEWIQASESRPVDWSSFKNKVVLVEFWATWCGPCIHAIPHLNDMADKFSKNPIQFIALTDEKSDVVASFLKKRPMRAWIGCGSGEMFKSYAANAIPKSVLIDAKGKIAWIGSPSGVTETLITAALEGKTLAEFSASVEGKRSRPGMPDSSEAEALLQVIIRPQLGEANYGGGGELENGLSEYGISLDEALRAAWDLSRYWMVVPEEISSDGLRYDIFVTVPKERSNELHSVYRRALLDAFGLTERREKRMANLYVLSAPKGKPPGLAEPGEATGTYFKRHEKDGYLHLMNQPLDGLARALEDQLARPVLNETHVSGRYDMELKWGIDSPILRAVRDQLGLEIVGEKREIEFVVIEKRK